MINKKLLVGCSFFAFIVFFLTFTLAPSFNLKSSTFATTALAAEDNTKKFKWKCFMVGPGGPASNKTPNSYLFAATDEIRRRTNGQLDISPVAGKALGLASSDMVRSLHFGLVQAADFSAGVASGEIPSINLLEIPGIVPSGNILLAKKLYRTLLPYWQDALQKKGVILLAGYLSVGRNVFTTKKLTSIDQIKGLKIRAKASTDGIVLRAFGAIPTPISFAETEMALRRGTVDGMTTVSQGITALKVTDITNTGFLSYYSGIIKLVGVSKQHWDKLPLQYQKIVRDVFVDVYDATWYGSRISEYSALEEFKSSGVKLRELTPAQHGIISRAGEESIGAWLEKAGPKGQEMFDLVKKIKAQNE